MVEREIIALFHPEKEKEKEKEKETPLGKVKRTVLDSLDDCASIGENKIVTSDSMVENVHFRLEWSCPEDLAIKLFQTNLSDIISSGGRPSWCLLNLGLPREIAMESKQEKFLERFASALGRECWRYEAPLLGGDTFRSELVFLSLSMGGQAERHIQRWGAQPGDHLYVTGDLGLSLAGLAFLEGKLELDMDVQSHVLEKHLQPQARFEWGQILSKMPELHAMIDISDGLLSDAIQLARANQIDICIDLDKIPIHSKLAGKVSPQDAILSGEELELLFLGSKGLSFPFPCTAVGWSEEVKEETSGVKLLQGGEDVPFPLGRFDHF